MTIIDGKVYQADRAKYVDTKHGEKLYSCGDETYFLVSDSGIRALTDAQAIAWIKGV